MIGAGMGGFGGVVTPHSEREEEELLLLLQQISTESEKGSKKEKKSPPNSWRKSCPNRCLFGHLARLVKLQRK